MTKNMIIRSIMNEVVTSTNLVWCHGCDCWHSKNYWQRCVMNT